MIYRDKSYIKNQTFGGMNTTDSRYTVSHLLILDIESIIVESGPVATNFPADVRR